MLLCTGMVVLCGMIVHQVATEIGANAVGGENYWSMELLQTVAAEIKVLFATVYTIIVTSRTGCLDLFSPAVQATALALLVLVWLMQIQKPVYLMSFATFKPPESWKCSHEEIKEIMRRQDCFTEESLEFMQRILETSGTGQATAWPPGITQCLHGDHGKHIKSDRSIETSRKEAATIIYDIVQAALDKAHVKPQEIDILVINCSLFSPTPSLCAMVLSHFNMRSDVATYNLSGMGCSASLLAIDLAKQLLHGRCKSGRSKKALVVSTEILTPNFYHGNERGFLIQNTLFRCGGAAIVLSNSWLDGLRAWYKLLHTVRVQGTNEAAYQCVYEGEDACGHRGVRLSKDIVKVAGKCMEKNFATLGPSILPYSEQIWVVGTIALRLMCTALTALLRSWNMQDVARKYIPHVKPYVPDFARGIDHFCIHAGGRAVIDGIEHNLRLETFHTEPSRMTLFNYGNTSSSSIWYELEYIQDIQRTNPLKKGDRVLQVAFGSGFKCTSGVWLKL
jgi:predicted naringenin-chalcone synthase